MSESPFVTYILFAYNQERYIREAVQGALSQTYSPLEIILSDDGSSDRTYEIMEEMAASYYGPHRIILNRNEPNIGVGRHVNKAFGLATGEWIVTGAGDDISEPDRCMKVMALAAANPEAGVIGMGWRDIDELGAEINSNLLNRYLEKRIDKSADPEWIQAVASGDFGAWGMSVAWRTQMIHSSPPLAEDVIQEDEVYSFCAVLCGYSIVYSPEIVVSYRRHGGNVSGYLSELDPEIVESRRTRRARMNLTTWRFIGEHVSNPRIKLENEQKILPANWKDLNSAIDFRIRMAEEEALWWDYSFVQRFLKTWFPARRRGRLTFPRELSRILPLRNYLAVEKTLSRNK